MKFAGQLEVVRLRRSGYDTFSGLIEVRQKCLAVTTGINFFRTETINAVFQWAALKQTQGIIIQEAVTSDHLRSPHLMVQCLGVS